jgi:hypothetical protein
MMHLPSANITQTLTPVCNGSNCLQAVAAATAAAAEAPSACAAAAAVAVSQLSVATAELASSLQRVDSTGFFELLEFPTVG